MRELWIGWPGPDGTQLTVKAHEDDDGRWAITDLYLHGAEISGETLRSLRMPQIEANAFTAAIRRDPPEAEPGWDDDTTLGTLRSLNPERKPRPRKRAPLTRPTGDDPERFYGLVAEAYREHQQFTSAPAKALAEEAGVPVTTVHRWVREARRRGHLPTGRKGRTG